MQCKIIIGKDEHEKMLNDEQQNQVTGVRKKLRFRGDSGSGSGVSTLLNDARIEELFDYDKDEVDSKENPKMEQQKSSFYDFFRIELTRGYVLEHDEERYSASREKIYSFMKIPRELEAFMAYGLLQCADSFLYIYTFLPIRFLLALWALITRPIARCLGLRRPSHRLLMPAEICDLLKGFIWILCSYFMFYVDTNMLYHLIKSQSIIKLYIFYNMLEVGDRLLSAFGQDIIDALFWTATEPKHSKRQHLGTLPHLLFAVIYVTLHSGLVMFQATTLNVAINSNNKGLLTIMMSNNFVELKGSVFKKFDKNNLFQLTCSDVRERFHLSVLLLIVLVQTMKEFSWRTEQFFVMLPDCLYVMITEVFVDWIKHAFITRFNEIPIDVYREYTTSLAYDMMQTRQKHAFSDHSDLVARRMGFIPFPLGVVLVKALYHALTFDNAGAIVIFFMVYLCLVTSRVLNTICTLGIACNLMKKHQEEKNQAAGNTVPPTPQQSYKPNKSTSDTATSPLHVTLQRSVTVENVVSSAPTTRENSMIRETASLGGTALFSNSDIDLDNVHLNENYLKANNDCSEEQNSSNENLARSYPELPGENKENAEPISEEVPFLRSHKRSESEPSIQLETSST